MATMTRALLMSALLPGLVAHVGTPSYAGEAKKLKVLVITGGHGYDKKTFPKTFAAATDMDIKILDTSKKGGSAAVFEDISKWDYNVFVLYNFKQKITEKQRANFLKLLDRGVGLVSLHHAIAAYPGWIEYEKVIGATYVLKECVRDGVKYPRPKWKHGVDFKIHVEDPSHPIVKGIEDFEIHDESYKLWVYHEGNNLLLSTDQPLNNRQIAWTRMYKGARVAYIQLGHDKGAYGNKVYQQVVARSIRWVSEGRKRTPRR